MLYIDIDLYPFNLIWAITLPVIYWVMRTFTVHSVEVVQTSMWACKFSLCTVTVRTSLIKDLCTRLYIVHL